MSQNAKRDAIDQTAEPGDARDATEPPAPSRVAPSRNQPARDPRKPASLPIAPPVHPSNPSSSAQDASDPVNSGNSLSTRLTTLGIVDRFTPEAANLNPALVAPTFNAQSIYDQAFAYYQWRFNDIAYSADSTVAYIAQADPAADRVAQVVVNTIVNKLIIANTAAGLAVGAINAQSGPPKGYLTPSAAASVIASIGMVSPHWSGEQFFVPNLNNAVPAYNDYNNVAVPNSHQFVGNPGMDQIVARFCATGNIPLRTTDWKIPGGSPYWLPIRVANNQRVTMSVLPDVHPDNFDPPGTVLATLCACTNQAAAAARYIILKSVETNVIFTLINTAYE